MSGEGSRPPRRIRALLRRVLAGGRGADVVSDLDQAWAEVRAGRGVAVAALWYAAQLIRPGTWRLALALRRVERREAGTMRPRAGGRSLAPVISWLDLKLGVRMLARHPGMSLVSVAAMAVAAAIAAGGFGLVDAMMQKELPLEGGARVVAIQNTDVRSLGSVEGRALHDFGRWRAQLASVRDLSAFVAEELPLLAGNELLATVRVARITASAFRVAPVVPALGRTLLPEDERASAPQVVVMAHDEWQRRFGGDPAILGRTLRLGATPHVVVGVLPEGFRFPVNHAYWIPLRVDPGTVPAGGGPVVTVFGRLTDDATMERAQAELDAFGARMAIDHPETHGHLEPRVLHYTRALVGVDRPAVVLLVRVAQVSLALLLVLVSANVAVLVYARTAARAGEIAIRTALGASRRRVIAQLFAEAFVLASCATALGLAVAQAGLGWFESQITGGRVDALPFWVDLGLSLRLVAYVAALTVLAAAIVGVAPALAFGRRSLQGTLQQLSSRGSVRLGRMWTALIVVQVAIAVAVLPYAVYAAGRFAVGGLSRPDYPVDELVHATIAREDERAQAGPDSAVARGEASRRYAAAVAGLLARVEADPAVAGIGLGADFPGVEARVEQVEPDGAGRRTWTWLNDVDPAVFDVFDVPLLAGRHFTPSERAGGGHVAIVDAVFADRALGGGNVLGRRVRLAGTAPDGEGAGPWLEIVGIVPAFLPPQASQEPAPRLFQPLSMADLPSPLHLAIRVQAGTAPTGFLNRFREIGASVGDGVRIASVQTAAQEDRERRQGLLAVSLAVAAIVGSVWLLSAAGVYALISFTVATRRREIGIRAALGAAPRRLLGGIFRRAALQLGAGAAAGLLLAEAIPRLAGGSFFASQGAGTLLPVLAIILGVGGLAALGPARRALAVQPIEVLREE